MGPDVALLSCGRCRYAVDVVEVALLWSSVAWSSSCKNRARRNAEYARQAVGLPPPVLCLVSELGGGVDSPGHEVAEVEPGPHLLREGHMGGGGGKVLA